MTRGQTRLLKKEFLERFRVLGNVTLATKQAGITDRTIVYDWRHLDPEFAEAFEAANQEATDHLIGEARRRGHDGVDEPVYYLGNVVGEIRKYSDVLLMFLLKARDHSFRDKVDLDVRGKLEHAISAIEVVPPDGSS